MKRLSIMDSIASLLISKPRWKSALQKTGLMAGFFIPFLVISQSVFATTFGPIPVVDQAENSQYFVHGRVVGSSWNEMEPRIKRPYTYWRVQIDDQPLGDSLGTEVVVRQPGGEVGDMGYNVAGAAVFTGGEEVFIALRDTDEREGVKEVVGLASGKYKVETTPAGEKVLINGLGLPVTGNDGVKLDPEAFTKLLKRVAKNEATDADRNVFVNRTVFNQHPESEMEHKREDEVRQQLASARALPADSANTQGKSGGNPAAEKPVIAENQIQKRDPASDEPGTGSSAALWILAAVLLLAFAGTMVLILRK